MRDATRWTMLVRDKDFIFNLAGQVSHGDSMRDPQLDLGVNCVSTMNLVEACRKHNTSVRMVYTSTRQVYGKPKELPVTEETDGADQRQRHQQAGGRVLPPALSPHLRHPLDGACG